jgi:hypothetical protein
MSLPPHGKQNTRAAQRHSLTTPGASLGAATGPGDECRGGGLYELRVPGCGGSRQPQLEEVPAPLPLQLPLPLCRTPICSIHLIAAATSPAAAARRNRR